MIKLIAFLKKHQRISNWVIIVSAIFISVIAFMLHLDDIIAYEAACNDPVYVQATITVQRPTSLFSTAESLESVLDYSYDGVYYQNVYYHGNQNPSMWEDHGTTITVAVNPNNPGQLVRHMLNGWSIWIPILLWGLGMSGLIYTLLLTSPLFCAWRVRAANKPALISRPYGKSKPEVYEPDYLKDIFILMLPILIITSVILSLIFPHTFSMIK